MGRRKKAKITNKSEFVEVAKEMSEQFGRVNNSRIYIYDDRAVVRCGDGNEIVREDEVILGDGFRVIFQEYDGECVGYCKIKELIDVGGDDKDDSQSE